MTAARSIATIVSYGAFTFAPTLLAAHLGFPTAWFMWTLQEAADGADTFRKNGQLAQDTANWTSVVTNIP